jgi:hypothetical protein
MVQRIREKEKRFQNNCALKGKLKILSRIQNNKSHYGSTSKPQTFVTTACVKSGAVFIVLLAKAHSIR